MVTPAPTIVRIIAVTDTRDIIEDGDRYVRVPGTGDARPCDRCSRTHEIHVDVETSDGRTMRIGQGCARGESTEVRSRIRSAVNAVKRRAEVARELAEARAIHFRCASADRKAAAMTPPEPHLRERRGDHRGDVQVWAMGDATVWTLPGAPFNDERRACLARAWRRDRYVEIATEIGVAAPVPDLWAARERVAGLETLLARAEARVVQSCGDTATPAVNAEQHPTPVEPAKSK